MSFPKFPEFRKLTLEDQPEYLKYFLRLKDPYCDYSFNNLLVWLNYFDDLEISLLNDNTIIRYTNLFYGRQVTYSLGGELRLEETLDELFKYLEKQSDNPKLYYVPKQIADAIATLNNPRYILEEDINNRDYVYNTDALVKMEGKTYENLRGRVNNFKKDNENIRVGAFDLKSTAERSFIESTIQKWSRSTASLHINDPEKWERPAIKRHLDLARYLPTHAYGLYINNDTLASIVIFHIPPHKEWIMVNHLKCDYHHREIYGYTTYRLASIAQLAGLKYMNFEQDLGIEGLQKIKTFFRPERFLQRYTLSLTPGLKNQ